MKTKIRKDGDTLIINFGGRLSYETQEPLREDLVKISKAIAQAAKMDTASKKIIFDLGGLEFVGSSGIASFVQALRNFNKDAPSRPRYCNVRSEFQKIIRAFDEEASFEIYETEDAAKKSFDH